MYEHTIYIYRERKRAAGCHRGEADEGLAVKEELVSRGVGPAAGNAGGLA